MERVGGRLEKIEGHLSTGQSPQWAVVPMEEEDAVFLGKGFMMFQRNVVPSFSREEHCKNTDCFIKPFMLTSKELCLQFLKHCVLFGLLNVDQVH